MWIVSRFGLFCGHNRLYLRQKVFGDTMPLNDILPVDTLVQNLQFFGYSDSQDNQMQRLRDVEDAKLRDDIGIADPATLDADQQAIYIDAIVDLVLLKIAVRDPSVAAEWREQIVDEVQSRIGTSDVTVATSVDQTFAYF